MQEKPIVKVFNAANGFIVEDTSSVSDTEYWAFQTARELSKWLEIHLGYHEEFDHTSEL